MKGNEEQASSDKDQFTDIDIITGLIIVVLVTLAIAVVFEGFKFGIELGANL